MDWDKISERVDKEIQIGTLIPGIKREINRPVTKKAGSEIQIRTGKKSRKYITKEMIRYAYETVESGKIFTRADLEAKFPTEYSQGGCVFSMTGGILDKLGIARCNGYGKGYSSVPFLDRR